MGPQSEAIPYAEGGNYDPSHSDDGGRHTTERDITMQDQHLPKPNGPDRKLNASPANSASGREGPLREGNRKPSTERTRSRTRTGRTGSGSLRLCKKCGEPLTGQFVRALGGTFHLDCFRCRVGFPPCFITSNCMSNLGAFTGLWPNSRIQVLSGRRREWRRTISPLRD